MKVACMDCGWTGNHYNGPLQGASCPQCGLPTTGQIDLITERFFEDT
jgi:ribosomal protein S27E